MRPKCPARPTILSRPPIGCESAFSRAADPERSLAGGKDTSRLTRSIPTRSIPTQSAAMPAYTVATTPLPDALPLFATGLGALGLLGWRRKRHARAVAQ